MIEDIISSTKTSVNTVTNTNSSIRSKVPSKTPAAPYLFDINTDSDLLPESLQVIFHSTVAKLILYFYSNQTGSTYDHITTIEESFTPNTKRLEQFIASSWVLGEHQDPESQIRNDYSSDNTYVHRCIICCTLGLQISHRNLHQLRSWSLLC